MIDDGCGSRLVAVVTDGDGHAAEIAGSFVADVVEEEGIKISGLYPYEIYELVLKEMLQRTPIPSVKPPLETFLEYYEVVGTKEISVVYDWSLAKTEKEMKKLQFQQVVEKIPAKYGSFWKYIF